MTPEINKMVREHLVCGAEIARRTGVSRATVTNWAHRYPKLAALQVGIVGKGPVYWWPQVQQVLIELGLPNEAWVEANRRQGAARVKKVA